MGLRRVIVLAAAVAVSCVRRPRRGRRGRRTPAGRLAEGRGQLHAGAPVGRSRSTGSSSTSPRAASGGRCAGCRTRARTRRPTSSSRGTAGSSSSSTSRTSPGTPATGSTNEQSVGIEHEGFTYGPVGFTDAQYHASARLAAWIARRSLMPIDRKHVIGHAQVPGGRAAAAARATTPIPARTGSGATTSASSGATPASSRLSVKPLLPEGPLRGVVPWRAKATGGHRGASSSSSTAASSASTGGARSRTPAA